MKSRGVLVSGRDGIWQSIPGRDLDFQGFENNSKVSRDQSRILHLRNVWSFVNDRKIWASTNHRGLCRGIQVIWAFIWHFAVFFSKSCFPISKSSKLNNVNFIWENQPKKSGSNPNFRIFQNSSKENNFIPDFFFSCVQFFSGLFNGGYVPPFFC